MTNFNDARDAFTHEHVFLGAGHDRNERKTWGVIILCSVMMLAEIIGGNLFGSLALVADGLHMSTHAGAMLIAALAYTYARKHAHDRRFVFGTGKLSDLAGFTSAIILAMIALLIGYEAVVRFLAPVPIRFDEAIPIAVVGLIVNIVSAWLLSGGDHGHSHGHSHGPDHAQPALQENMPAVAFEEHGHHDHHNHHDHHEEAHSVDARDHNMRAAYIHVIADAAVSVLAIIGLLLARQFGWLWMDPLAGVIGAFVIANWSLGLIRITGATLIDASPDTRTQAKLMAAIEEVGDQVADLHVWRLGPGHLGAVISVVTREPGRSPRFYHGLFKRFDGLSHVTVEVNLSGAS